MHKGLTFPAPLAPRSPKISPFVCERRKVNKRGEKREKRRGERRKERNKRNTSPLFTEKQASCVAITAFFPTFLGGNTLRNRSMTRGGKVTLPSPLPSSIGFKRSVPFSPLSFSLSPSPPSPWRMAFSCHKPTSVIIS